MLEMPVIRPLTPMQQLEQERELLGLYVSGHPLDQYEAWNEQYDMIPIHRLHELVEGTEVIVYGMVLQVKPIVTRKGQQMAFLELEDRVSSVETVLFPETWKSYHTIVNNGVIVAALGRVQQGDEDVKLIVSQLYGMDDPALLARLKSGIVVRRPSNVVQRPKIDRKSDQHPRQFPDESMLYLKITSNKETPGILKRLQSLLKKHPGKSSVTLFYERDSRVLQLSVDYRVEATPVLIKLLEKLLGEGTVKQK
jgi:DNA polymerase-3 subunit alpha